MRISAAVARLPFNALRVQAYRWLGCEIAKKVTIGYKAVIASRICVLHEGVHIGCNCSIACREFHAGPKARILSGNVFTGDAAMKIGVNVRIGNDHLFDCWSNITIGDNTWIAGRGSQFWTHGTSKSVKDRSIVIGSDAYIGSGSLFAPGSGVADGCLVLLGSVVTTRFESQNCKIGGNPARLLMNGQPWREDWS